MKKAIIIGATSGIGKALAVCLIENNYRVGITGRREALLTEIKSKNPEAYVTRTMDVQRTQDIIPLLDELTAELGGLDLLVISAGTGDVNEKLDFAIEENTIQTNILGFTLIATWAFSYFQRQQAGHLVVFSSIAGLRGNGHAPAYSATKAYQINYVEGLRQRARQQKFPCTITDIRPGFVDTDMAKGDGLFWVMPVEKTAQQIYNAIARKKKVAYVTKRWGIIAFLLQFIPRKLYEKMG